MLISEILFTFCAHCRREKSDRLTESLSDVSKLIIIKYNYSQPYMIK